MKGLYKKILPCALAAFSLTATACSGKKDVEIVVYDGYEVHYQTNDGDLANFLNDFSHRNLRYDEYATGQFAVADGTGFAKNWETMGLAWHNSAGTALGEDKMAKIYNFLSSIDQDGLGMIYNTHNSRESALVESKTGEAAIPQGWPFPIWTSSTDDPTMFGKLRSLGSTAFDFNSLDDWQSEKWVAEGGSFAVDGETGYAYFATDSLEADQAFRFYRTDIAELERAGGVISEYSPFIEIALDFKSYHLDDYYVIWQTEDGGDQWYSVPHNYVVTTANDSFESYTDRCYLAMYLAENWDKQVITKLGLEFRPEAGEKLSVKGGQIDYIRCQYDTRQSNATYQWILSLYNYVRYTNDMEVLQKLMPKARRAILFLTHALEGEKGLLDISYMYGHNGIGMYKLENGRYNFDTVNGVGNGYWDLMVSSEKCLEANTYFYQALCAMSDLEQRIAAANLTVTEESVVRNRMPGQGEIKYTYTAESLAELAATVKTNMEKDIQPVKTESGRYDNAGGFWNPQTGRFASGINEETGAILDYGYVYWNLESICAGIGTAEQQLSVMQWIDGERIVEGDTSTGEDIYFYEFAPRFSTKECSEAISTFGYNILKADRDEYGTTWSRQLQNGGAAIAWSYYDLVARAKVLGKDNAYKRLQGIQKWYEKVLENTEGDGWDFYGGYYEQLAAEAEMKALDGDDSEYGIWSVQDSLRKGPGALGLDAEFIESIILIKAIPDAFFGMETNGYDNITFQNNLPSDLKTFQIDNMKFGNCLYSIRATADSLEILNAKGAVREKQTITLRFAEPKKKYSVYINGEKTQKYTVENGIIYVTVPFDMVKVTVK
ncbi:MAG: hypothetical protein IJX49_06855 [Clostridia bacterium]|nr:hypothetical protein [Clostridia bacterium]